MTYWENHIAKVGGILSGDLILDFVKVHEISKEAAKKRIERLTPPIHKLKGFFGKNQSFIYHASQFNTREYFEKLNEACEVAAKRYHAVILGMQFHHGILRKDEVANYSFSPLVKRKGHVQFQTLLQKLLQHEILYDSDEHYTLNLYLYHPKTSDVRRSRAVEFAKKVVLDQFATWSKNIGLTSFHTERFNSEVAGFQFAFTSPSYIHGLVHYNGDAPLPGFVAADVLLGNSTKLEHVDFFIQKITSIKASNKSLRLFPVLIVDGVDLKGFNRLKSHGVFVASIKEIFGERYVSMLKELINTVTNAGAILKKNPEEYLRLMDELTKLVDGRTNNLRGDLFELAVGYYYGKFCKSLDIGRIIRAPGEAKSWEIDVLASYENEVRAIECKATKGPIDLEYVNKYLGEKIPHANRYFNEKYTARKQVYEIWSVGGFTPDAEKRLEEARKATTKYRIDFLGKREILERAKELESPKFRELLKEYYFRDI